MPLIRLRHMLDDELKSERGTNRTHTRLYVGVHTDRAASPWEVRADPLTPKEGDPDADDPAARIVSVSCKRRGRSQMYWNITTVSTTEVDEFDPVNQGTKWSVSTVLYERPIVKDVRGNWITNTAGDLIQGATDNVLGFTFTGRASIPDGPVNWIDDFGNTLNDSPVVIKGRRCAEKTVWLRSVSIGEPERYQGSWICPSEVVCEVKPDGWAYEPLNQGYREIEEQRIKNKTTGRVSVVRRLVEIRDAKGQPISQPAFLNSDGKQYRVRDPGTDQMVLKDPLDPVDIIRLKYDVKRTSSFARLNFIR